MKPLLLVIVFALNIPIFSQQPSQVKNSSFYEALGYQTFSEYKLALKVPCQLTEYSKGKNDLDYVGLDEPYTSTSGATYMIAVKKLPGGFRDLSASEQQKLTDDIHVGRGDCKKVYFELNGVETTAYLYETFDTSQQRNSRALVFYKNNNRFSFHILSNDRISERFNHLTNNIIFY